MGHQLIVDKLRERQLNEDRQKKTLGSKIANGDMMGIGTRVGKRLEDPPQESTIWNHCNIHDQNKHTFQNPDGPYSRKLKRCLPQSYQSFWNDATQTTLISYGIKTMTVLVNYKPISTSDKDSEDMYASLNKRQTSASNHASFEYTTFLKHHIAVKH